MMNITDGNHPAVDFLLMVAVVLIIAYAAAKIGFMALRRITRHHALALKTVEDMQGVGIATICVIALAAAQDVIPWPAQYLTTINHVLMVAIIVMVTWLLVKLTKSTSSAVIAHLPQEELVSVHGRRMQTQTRLLARTMMTVIVIIGFAAALAGIVSAVFAAFRRRKAATARPVDAAPRFGSKFDSKVESRSERRSVRRTRVPARTAPASHSTPIEASLIPEQVTMARPSAPPRGPYRTMRDQRIHADAASRPD